MNERGGSFDTSQMNISEAHALQNAVRSEKLLSLSQCNHRSTIKIENFTSRDPSIPNEGYPRQIMPAIFSTVAI